MRALALAFVLAAVVFASGCAGVAPTTPSPSGETPGLTQVNMTLEHAGGYSPSEIRTKVNNTVRIFAISNQVSHLHGIAIDEFGINVAVAAGPGMTPQVIEFKPDRAGTFAIYCKTCETGPLGPHPWFRGTLIVE